MRFIKCDPSFGFSGSSPFVIPFRRIPGCLFLRRWLLRALSIAAGCFQMCKLRNRLFPCLQTRNSASFEFLDSQHGSSPKPLLASNCFS